MPDRANPHVISAPSARRVSRSTTSGFRADIQGLRAIAVTMVVLFHVWPNRLPGGYVGVDVFFVISGFLITSHLLAKPPRGAADLAEFWSRRIRRLLPAALVVLGTTLVATRLFAPPTQWASAAKEVIASALYVQNWVLAGSSVDYLAADSAPSPVQHFWSLSVEEQFYVFWPILILVVFWIARRYRRAGRNLSRLAILLVVVASLAYSVWATSVQPARAYFVTPTRMWELAVGALVAATVADRVRERAPWQTVVAWLGILAIAATGFLFTGDTPFPSYTALLPVLGCALVIAVNAQGNCSPTRLLRARPIQRLGDLSYSIYLWHWPLVVLVPYVLGGDFGRTARLGVLGATVLLSELSKRWVEDRYRRPGPRATRWTSYRFAAAGMAGMVLLGGLQLAGAAHRESVAQRELAEAVSGGDPCFGAAALAKGPKSCPVDLHAPMVPKPALAKKDRSLAAQQHCWNNSPYTGHKTCTFGSGPVKVALVGNSHADHWLPALRPLAKRHGWEITTYLVSQCNPTDSRLKFATAEKSENCHAWGRWMMKETKRKKFDLIITSERQSVPVKGHSLTGSTEAATRGYETFLRRWKARTDSVFVVLRDLPYPRQDIGNVPDCLAQHEDDRLACSGTPDEWDVDDPLFLAAKKLSGRRVRTVDLRRYLCSPDRCRSVNGGVITYYDGSHMSATYAKTMAPFLAQPLRKAVNS